MSHEYLLVFTINFNTFSELSELKGFIATAMSTMGLDEGDSTSDWVSSDQTFSIKKLFYYGNIFTCRVALSKPLAPGTKDDTMMIDNTSAIEPIIDAIFPKGPRRLFIWSAVPWSEFIKNDEPVYIKALGSSGGIGTGRGD